MAIPFQVLCGYVGPPEDENESPDEQKTVISKYAAEHFPGVPIEFFEDRLRVEKHVRHRDAGARMIQHLEAGGCLIIRSIFDLTWSMQPACEFFTDHRLNKVRLHVVEYPKGVLNLGAPEVAALAELLRRQHQDEIQGN